MLPCSEPYGILFPLSFHPSIMHIIVWLPPWTSVHVHYSRVSRERESIAYVNYQKSFY